MLVATTSRYGGPEVLEITEAPEPVVGPNELLIEIVASPVTAGDRRLRAADFPGIAGVVGLMMFGIWAPREPVQGSMFSGRVVATGNDVRRFAVGDEVFGSADNGAYAERMVVSEDGAIAKKPDHVSHEAAAAVPYGAGTALHFLQTLAGVQSGESVLILGASGGVGRYAVQLAKHMGATVTAVCSARHAARVLELGADHVIDYNREDFTTNGKRYDVIFDIADATSFGRSRGSLSPTGRYLTLYISPRALWNMLRTRIMGGQRALFAVAMGDQAQMETLADLLGRGIIHPTITARFPLRQISAAHSRAEERADGEIIVLPQAQDAQVRVAV